jgi:hypothetical protein
MAVVAFMVKYQLVPVIAMCAGRHLDLLYETSIRPQMVPRGNYLDETTKLRYRRPIWRKGSKELKQRLEEPMRNLCKFTVICVPTGEGFMNKSQRLRRGLSALTFLCTLSAFAAPSARADGSVNALGMGMGARPGEMPRFDAVVRQYNASGERFRIDSHCQSACTIFLSIRNVCITPDATLLFHSGGDPSTNRMNPASTQHMLDAYNPALRKYVSDNHFMDTFAFHTISGHEMIAHFGYPACP